jgi:hypothetical protein
MTTLDGQWLGHGGGTNTGWTVLEVERRKGALYGSALLFDEDLANPCILAEIGPITTDTPTSLQARLFPIDRRSGAVLSEDERQQRHPDTQLPKAATIKTRFDGSSLVASWSTAVGTSGTATLTRQELPKESSIPLETGSELSWS